MCDVRGGVLKRINHFFLFCFTSPMSVLLTRRQSASPSTLQPLTEPIANDLMTMIHEQHPHQTVTFDHLAVPAEQHSSHQPKQHAQSDCGHDSPPNHSLLRHFSLRSRNSFSLRKSRHQNRVLPPPPLLALEPYSKPEKVRTDSGSTASQSHSTNGSSLSLWKKWRVRSVSEYSSRNTSALGLVEHEEGPVTGYHNATSTHQAPVRKRSLFLPFVTVTRLIAPFQFSSSEAEAEDSSVGIVSFLFLSSVIPIITSSSNGMSKVDICHDPSPCVIHMIFGSFLVVVAIPTIGTQPGR